MLSLSVSEKYVSNAREFLMPRQMLHLRPSQLPPALHVTWAITGIMSLLSTRPAVDFIWIFFGVAEDDPCEN